MKPMLLTIGFMKELDRTDLLFEPKLDGVRALCKVNKALTFYSRNEINITNKYPEFQFRDAIKATNAVLDGEIIVLDEELRPRFELWQEGYEATYVVFDILKLNGKSLIKLPLIERKELLNEVVTDTPYIQKCFYTTDGRALWKEMIKRGMEGVIAKEAQSLYYPGKRSSVWQKIKSYKTLEALVIGYTSKKRALSSLLLGIYDGKQLRYVGKVGTGFGRETRLMLLKKLAPLIRKTPFHRSYVEVISKPEEVTWVRPRLIVEIKYLEFTKRMRLRSPVYERLRLDKNPAEITFKEQEIRV